MRRFCFSCDLKDDVQLIEKYKAWHAPGGVWPEIIQSIKDAGINEMEIYLTGNRMFMIMEVDESFSFERKEKIDSSNPKVQEWEDLMWTFQQALPWANEGEKWVEMEKVFMLSEQDQKLLT